MASYSTSIRRFQENLYAGAIAAANPFGKILFVDSANGDDSANDGHSPRHAYATITAAVAVADAGDTLLLLGSFDEAVTVAVAGVRIVGVGTGPNQCVWTGTADEVCLTLTADDCLDENIRFRPPAYAAGTPAAIQLSDADYTTIRRCRFQGRADSHNAIYSAAATSDNVTVEDCEFVYLNTATYGAAIKGVEAGGLSYSGWRILRCTFHSCVTAVDICGRVCLVQDCVFAEYGITAASAVGAVCTKALDLSGTNSGANMVHGCTFAGDYSTAGLYVGGTNDDWTGNYATDTAEAEVGDNGITILPPAA